MTSRRNSPWARPYSSQRENVGDEHSRPHNVLQSGSQAIQRALDIPQTLNTLQVSIVDANNFTVIAKRRGSRDVDAIADADCAGVADD